MLKIGPLPIVVHCTRVYARVYEATRFSTTNISIYFFFLPLSIKSPFPSAPIRSPQQVMSPSQASSDDFPRLIGAENFDVWKTRVCAALDGKHLLGFVTKPDYDGVSEEESEDSGSDMSDVDDSPKTKPAEEIDSDAVDYEDSDDELKPPSGSDEESGDSDTTTKTKKLPVIRPFNRSDAKRASKREARTKPKPLNPRDRRCQEAKTKAFLMKTMDNTHVRLVKDLKTSYEIFQAICAKYEGAAFHGDPYFIQHYFMELKYEEGGDLDDFFLKLENAMNATSEATESVMTGGQKSIYLFHALPKSWKDDLRVWKGQRKYFPYGELKTNIEQKVREIQAEERYTLAKGTLESQATKNERALVATPKLHPGGHSSPDVCSYSIPTATTRTPVVDATTAAVATRTDVITDPTRARTMTSDIPATSARYTTKSAAKLVSSL
ncbi:hypothetical protein ON010_g17797 [Phytophthora cinnamomi]|nr:hypothetical protein ON010_g17797 [Phytophthora cinnamomi]